MTFKRRLRETIVKEGDLLISYLMVFFLDNYLRMLYVRCIVSAKSDRNWKLILSIEK